MNQKYFVCLWALLVSTSLFSQENSNSRECENLFLVTDIDEVGTGTQSVTRIGIDNDTAYRRLVRQCVSWRTSLGCDSIDPRRAAACSARVKEAFSGQVERYREIPRDSESKMNFPGVTEAPGTGVRANALNFIIQKY